MGVPAGVSGPTCNPTSPTTTICTASLDASAAGLAVGNYQIVATLAPDTSNNGATGNGTITITTGTSTLGLATSNALVAVDTPITFTATVSPITGVTPTGAVSFTATLGGNHCDRRLRPNEPGGDQQCDAHGRLHDQCTHGGLVHHHRELRGRHKLYRGIEYGGPNHYDSDAGSGCDHVQCVGPGQCFDHVYGCNYTEHRHCAVGYGELQRKAGAGAAAPISSCTTQPLVAGSATCVTSALVAGSYTITATVASDGNFSSATSAGLPQTVTTVTPTVALSTTNASPTVNGSVTLTATITPNAGIIPTGKVSFTTTLSGTTTPIAGCTAVSLTPGTPWRPARPPLCWPVRTPSEPVLRPTATSMLQTRPRSLRL